MARAFLGRLRQLEPSTPELIDDRSLGEWIAWAEQRAREADPVEQGGEAIFEDIAKVQSWTRLD